MNRLITNSMPLCLLGILGVLSGSVSAATVAEYSQGHADIGLAFESGELKLQYHLGEGAVVDGVPLPIFQRTEPDDAYVRVADSAKVTPTTPVPWLGTDAGDDIWVLPQSGGDSSRLELPFLGWNAEELSGLGFASATYSLTALSGPGELALWQGGFTPNIYMQTIDGIDPEDKWELGIGGHDHANFGFTKEGIYDLELTATVDFGGGGGFVDVETFRFLVGSATAIPEPSSFAAVTLGTVGLLMRRRRKPLRS